MIRCREAKGFGLRPRAAMVSGPFRACPPGECLRGLPPGPTGSANGSGLFSFGGAAAGSVCNAGFGAGAGSAGFGCCGWDFRSSGTGVWSGSYSRDEIDPRGLADFSVISSPSGSGFARYVAGEGWLDVGVERLISRTWRI